MYENYYIWEYYCKKKDLNWDCLNWANNIKVEWKHKINYSLPNLKHYFLNQIISAPVFNS